MDTKVRIFEIIRNNKKITGSEIARQLGITRQAVNKHIKTLLKTGLVFKGGNTRDSFYTTDSEEPGLNKMIKRRFTTKVDGLREDQFFEKTDRIMGIRNHLRENVYNIFHYIFTEMVNNVIDHSQSDLLSSVIEIDSDEIRCEIRDYGIGIFESVKSKFLLNSEIDALLEIIKGKRTTQPERHSGEGIFFSSKAADKFVIRSHKLEVVFDNLDSDTFIKEGRFFKGTCVKFYIKRYSKRVLREVFDLYSKEEFNYEFFTTSVKVKLFGEEFISRSEAKRLLTGLDKFKEIILDFEGVKSIGQGFADEIFRVFANQNPDIVIKTVNTTPIIEAMIKHSINTKNS